MGFYSEGAGADLLRRAEIAGGGGPQDGPPIPGEADDVLIRINDLSRRVSALVADAPAGTPQNVIDAWAGINRDLAKRFARLSETAARAWETREGAHKWLATAEAVRSEAQQALTDAESVGYLAALEQAIQKARDVAIRLAAAAVGGTGILVGIGVVLGLGWFLSRRRDK